MKRKNKILPLAAAMVIVLAVLVLGGGTVLAEEGGFAGGDGTEENPWLIGTPEQLATVAEAVYLDKHFVLTDDIVLADYLSAEGAGYNEGKGWEPIGKLIYVGSPDNAPFTGSFDGGGHTISNLIINRPATGGIGLFGYTGEGAEIRDLRLDEVEVTGSFYVGGLVGLNQGEIINCSMEGSITGDDDVGGLVGYNNSGTISDSYAEGNVTGSNDFPENIGGLVGYNAGDIDNSYSMANVVGFIYAGGLTGCNGGDITNSHATGEVTGEEYIGGLVGYNSSFDSGATITNSHATGKVVGEERVGGLVGENQGDISNSYANGNVEGFYNVGGLVGLNDNEIVNSHSVSTVIGNSYVGGLVGSNCSGGTINSSYATGEVTGDESAGYAIGGLVGQNQDTIENSYATGKVIGYESVGGLVGQNEASISNSYAIGQVTGQYNVGGLVGDNDNGNITSSFWDTQTTDLDSSDGGIGKTTAEMKSYLTFIDAGWDFMGETENGVEYIWGIDESAADSANGGYPFLSCQGFDHKVWPAVTTKAADDIYPTSAVGHGEIINIGYPNPSQHGFVWNDEVNPTLADNKTEEGAVSVAGEFDSTIIGLDPETVYYVRAYATNDLGTVYGEQVQFATSSLVIVKISEIPGVTVPAAGGTPVTSIEETDQYIGTVSWNPAHNPFKGETVYTAIITLTAKTDYTFEGVAADFFTVTGAETVNNDADSGIITAIFPETEEVGETYTVTITVKDSEGAAIEGAEITINSETFTADTEGVVTIELGNGTYPYSVTKTGFYAITDGSITVAGATVAEVVVMDPAPEITVTATSPDNGTTGVSLTPTITVTFNENVDADTGYGQITLKDAGNNSMDISTSISGSVLTITPDNSLSYSTAYTVTIPAAAVKSEATGANMGQQYQFSFTTQSAPSGGGGGGSRSVPDYSAEITGGGAPGTEISIDVNTRLGIAVISLGKQAEDLLGGEKIPVITVPPIEGVDTYTLELPGTYLCSSSGGDILTFSTHLGDLTIPGNMLSGTGLESSGDIGITIGEGDKSSLPDNVRQAIGDRPIIQLTLTVDGDKENWSNRDAPVTVSIPYEPTEEELADPEHITVWYIDGEGNAVEVPNGRYDPVTGTVTFATTHFSRYAVVYIHKTFDDLGGVEWARQQIEVLASKGIVRSITECGYFPSVNITRADFLYSLVRTLGVDAAFDGNFDDIEDNAYYYKEIGIAKKLGITSGTGDNRFCPHESITRQDMITLTVRALDMLGMVKEQGPVSGLDIFIDKSLIAGYALEGIATAVKEGLIIGSGDNINPLGKTTRAEAAVFLHRIYNK